MHSTGFLRSRSSVHEGMVWPTAPEAKEPSGYGVESGAKIIWVQSPAQKCCEILDKSFNFFMSEFPHRLVAIITVPSS